MYQYYYSNKKIFWNSPILKYVPNPFKNDSWLQFQKLPENTKLNYVNSETAQIFIPFNQFENPPQYFKVSYKNSIKLYYFLGEIINITTTGILYKLVLDYYNSYCVYLLQLLNKGLIQLKRSGINHKNTTDHTNLINIKNNIMNDSLIKTEELLYSTIYNEITVVNKLLPDTIKTYRYEDYKLSWDFYKNKDRLNKPDNSYRYGVYAVFLLKGGEDFGSRYALFPVLAERDYLYYANPSGDKHYVCNTFKEPNYSYTNQNNTLYGLAKDKGWLNSFYGFFRGPVLTMRDFGENFDYYHTIANQATYFFVLVENLKNNEFVLQLKPNNITPINYHYSFIENPYKLYDRVLYFNENLYLKELYSFSLNNPPTFNLFVNNGICFSPQKIYNENANDSIYTFGGVLATNTDNYLKEQINNRNQLNSGIMNQAFSTVNQLAGVGGWANSDKRASMGLANLNAIGKGISTGLGLIQGGIDLAVKNHINKANMKNTAQNISNLDYKSAQDNFKMIYELTKNKNNLNTNSMNQYCWINEVSEKDKQKINLLYTENGFLFNAKLDLENTLKEIEAQDSNRLYFPFLIDWDYYINQIKNLIDKYNPTDYFPYFDHNIINKCVNFLSEPLVICIKNRIE